jgi:uncharacterized membrane protein YhaH (DUF805 family)
MNWYLKVLKEHYFDFKGRARRTEFWMFILINIIISVILAVLDDLLGLNFGSKEQNGFLSTIYSLLIFVPGLSVTVRRLHDANKSGWYYALILIPIIGWIWLLVLLCTDSFPKGNKWGENPKGTGNNAEIDAIGTE